MEGLKVAEALEEDVGKGIARINAKWRKKLGLIEGNYIEISGKNKTVAMVDIEYGIDRDMDIMRIDSVTRRNAGAQIGDVISTKKTFVESAEKVILEHEPKDCSFGVAEDVLKDAIMGKVIMKSNIIKISESYNKDINACDLPSGKKMLLSGASFIVADTMPCGVVRIAENTNVQFQSEDSEIGGLRHENRALRKKLIVIGNTGFRNRAINEIDERVSRLSERVQDCRRYVNEMFISIDNLKQSIDELKGRLV